MRRWKAEKGGWGGSDRRLESTSVISESVSVSQKEIHSDRRVESAIVISVSVGKIHG